MCKDVCIPGAADLKLTLPVVQGSPALNDRWAAAFAATRSHLAREVDGLHATATGQGKTIDLAVPFAGQAVPREVYFFSAIEGLVEPSRAQPARVKDGVLHLSLPVAAQLTANGSLLDGVLVSSPPVAAGAAAISLTAQIQGPVAAGDPAPRASEEAGAGVESAFGPSSGSLTFGLAILLALAGGVVLNLMPCVFPVISIKMLAFAEKAHGNRSALRHQALAFSAGVVLSFAVFAAVMLSLRESGAALGWGFQLQSPAVVLGLAVLFTLLGLNLFGVFEVLLSLPSTGPARRVHPVASAFAGGVIAAVIACPCTAPFMGAALGFALTQPVAVAFFVFIALGAGMALPYVLLSWFPGWLKRLPRPGPWLVRVRELLAFPLFATVIWLLWVLAQQVGIDAATRAAAALLVFGFAAWLWGIAQRGGAPWVRWCGMIAAAGGVALAISGLAEAQRASEPAPAQAAAGWQPFSSAALADLQAQGRPVFVDFTAAWCVTCQVNKKLVLEQPAMERAFAEKSVALMRADWTRRDDAITDALHALGRNGVPVYVLYRPGSAPLLLPEVLQQRAIRDALATLTPPLKAASR